MCLPESVCILARMCGVGIPDWFSQNLGFSVPFTCVLLFAPSLMSLPSSPDSSHFSRKSEELCLCEEPGQGGCSEVSESMRR